MSTDNAYVQADMVGVSTDVSGLVGEVDVHDNQQVTKGQILFKLDPQQFQLALDRTNAQLAGTGDDLRALQASYRNVQAQIDQAQKDVDFNMVNFHRQEQLIANNFTPKATYDAAQNTLQNAQQKLASLQEQLAGLAANLNGRSRCAGRKSSQIQGRTGRARRGRAPARPFGRPCPLRRHRDQRAVVAARPVSRRVRHRLQHRLDQPRLDPGQPERDRADLCPAGTERDRRGRYLSRATMDRNGRQHQPGLGVELLAAAGGEHQRQLGSRSCSGSRCGSALPTRLANRSCASA